jgi:hypothetical protein
MTQSLQEYHDLIKKILQLFLNYNYLMKNVATYKKIILKILFIAANVQKLSN